MSINTVLKNEVGQVSILVGIATDDSENFTNRHFGDANCFDIYELTAEGIKFVKQIKNTVDEEEPDLHADPEKAKGIARLLKKEGVNVLVSKIFGPNIKRVRKKFVCVVSRAENIAAAKLDLVANITTIKTEWNAGETREVLKF